MTGVITQGLRLQEMMIVFPADTDQVLRCHAALVAYPAKFCGLQKCDKECCILPKSAIFTTKFSTVSCRSRNAILFRCLVHVRIPKPAGTMAALLVVCVASR